MEISGGDLDNPHIFPNIFGTYLEISGGNFEGNPLIRSDLFGYCRMAEPTGLTGTLKKNPPKQI